MTVYLLRHGKTQGNVERRYIGSTDQPLCSQGRAELRNKTGPRRTESLPRLCSGAGRRRRSLYPGKDVEIVDDLRETDFGAFENHTYEELKDDPQYRAWLDVAGSAAPPGGESKGEQQARTVRALQSVMAACGEDERVAFVVHGGTIMCLLRPWRPPTGSTTGRSLTAAATPAAGTGAPDGCDYINHTREMFFLERKGQKNLSGKASLCGWGDKLCPGETNLAKKEPFHRGGSFFTCFCLW